MHVGGLEGGSRGSLLRCQLGLLTLQPLRQRSHRIIADGGVRGVRQALGKRELRHGDLDG